MGKGNQTHTPNTAQRGSVVLCVAGAMPQGKSAMVSKSNLNSKSAIQKKKANAKLLAKKAKKKARVGGGSADQRSKMFTQRGHDAQSVQLTKCIQKRISGDVHSKAAKKGSGFSVVKSTDFVDEKISRK